VGDMRGSNGGLGIYINRGCYLHILGRGVVGGSEVVGPKRGSRTMCVHGPLQSLIQGSQACARMGKAQKLRNAGWKGSG